LKNSALPILALLLAVVPPAMAGTVACPDLEKAVQIASCPAEEELKYTYTGYCSDDGRPTVVRPMSARITSFIAS
jgi:hypothetical protein